MALALLVHAGPAPASPGQESIFIDDPQLVHGPESEVDATLARLKSMGVDRVRITLLWSNVAPEPKSRTRPDFDATDPDAYPAGAWEPFDRVVRLAAKHDLGVLMNPTGPGPAWAHAPAPRAALAGTYAPSPAEFGEFVTAAGRRYSGDFRPRTGQVQLPQPQRGLLDGLLGIGQPVPAPAQPAATRVGRVDYWSLWNEPNYPGWLTPQWLPDPRGGGRPPLALGATLYRQLADAGWLGLEASGHADDVVLIGETAPRGWNRPGVGNAMRTLEFIREMYCLTASGKPYAGAEAAVRACPSGPEGRAGFAAAHPGLFRVSGFAHHPYRFKAPPGESDPVADNAPLADTDRVVRTLDNAFRRFRQAKRLPIWITEYGYQTSPPDPFGGVSWRVQATWLSEAEFLAYRNPRVVSMAQFLLLDDAPRAQFSRRDARHWATFQTGLYTLGGKAKPSAIAYERSLHVTPAEGRAGRYVTIFGQYRPGAAGERIAAALEFRARGSSGWRPVRSFVTTNPRGYLRGRVKVPAEGSFRLVFKDPGTGASARSLPARVDVQD